MRTDGRADRQTDRQTGVKKLIVAFRNFANAPKKKKRYMSFLCNTVIGIGSNSIKM